MKLSDLDSDLRRRIKSIDFIGDTIQSVEFHPELPPIMPVPTPSAYQKPPWIVDGVGSMTRPKPGEYTLWNQS